MDRRQFLKISSASLAAAGLGVPSLSAAAGLGVTSLGAAAGSGSLLSTADDPSFSPLAGGDRSYNIVLLGDTHFDTEPADVYHSHYNEPTEWLNRVQRQEFARNGEMWRERCPRLLKRAACLVDDDTRMVFQTGDLIQGDCGTAEVHRKMLDDVMNAFKAELGGLPFVTVVGNHDIRGNYDLEGNYQTDGPGAKAVYADYMPGRMSQELGIPVTKTTFSFNIGDDAFLVLDFNKPDDEEIERMLKATSGARNTFVLVHGPLMPYDGSNCRWFFHGKDTPGHTEARRHFRAEFARRNVIALCGHTHRTELADWRGDGGRITQMTMSSVWSEDSFGVYTIDSEGAAQFGELRKQVSLMPNGSPIKDETPIFDEYRSGLTRYVHSPSAGCYKMTVRGRKVTMDFYAGDSSRRSARFELR